MLGLGLFWLALLGYFAYRNFSRAYYVYKQIGWQNKEFFIPFGIGCLMVFFIIF